MNQLIETMIDEVVEEIYKAYPELLERFGENGRIKCREDNQHHFHHLELAYTLNNPVVFLDYTKWLNSLLTSRGMKSEHIIDNFERIQKVIDEKGLQEKEEYYQNCLTQAISLLKEQE